MKRSMKQGGPRWPWGRPQGGFTLIEILVVISVIAILSSLVLSGIHVAQINARSAAARAEVSGLELGLENYVQDVGEYPSSTQPEAPPAENEFPALYSALLGERRPAGPGGPSAPYTRVSEANLAVLDPATGDYRKATRAEARDDGVEKYLLDPFHNPYVYRPNRGRPRQPYMVRSSSADIYSLGPNELDDTRAGNEDGDDIGNWR